MKINLLKTRRVLSEKEYLAERGYLRISIVALLIVLFIVVAMASWNFILSNKLAQVEKGIATATKEMQNLTEANAQQLYLKSRLNLISGFLSDRSLSREALQQVLSINIPGVNIGGVSNVAENELEVKVDASDAFSLIEAVNYYKNDNKFFIQVVSKGITRDAEGKYQLSLILTIPGNKK